MNLNNSSKYRMTFIMHTHVTALFNKAHCELYKLCYLNDLFSLREKHESKVLVSYQLIRQHKQQYVSSVAPVLWLLTPH